MAPARSLADFVDAEDGEAAGRGVVAVGGVVVGLASLELAAEGVTTFLALLAAAGDAHGDGAGDDHHEEEADDAKGDGEIEAAVVGGGFVGGISHVDEDGSIFVARS